MRKGRKGIKFVSSPITHCDAVQRVLDRMLSGVYNPRSLNPEDDLIHAIDLERQFRDLVSVVSQRDLAILSLLLEGSSYREVGIKLSIPSSTVGYRVKRMKWARFLIDVPQALHTDPACIGATEHGLKPVRRRGKVGGEGQDPWAWHSLGDGNYRRKAHPQA